MLSLFLGEESPWAGTFAKGLILFSLTISKLQIAKIGGFTTIVTIAFCGNKINNKTARISLLTIQELMIG